MSDYITIDRDVLFTVLARYRDTESAKLVMEEIERYANLAPCSLVIDDLESECKSAKTENFYKEKCISLMSCVEMMYGQEEYDRAVINCPRSINKSLDEFCFEIHGVKFGREFMEVFVDILFKAHAKTPFLNKATVEDVFSQILGFKDYVEAVKWVFSRLKLVLYVENHWFYIVLCFNDSVVFRNRYDLCFLLETSGYIDVLGSEVFLESIQHIEEEYRKSREYQNELRVQNMLNKRNFVRAFNLPSAYLGLEEEKGEK